MPTDLTIARTIAQQIGNAAFFMMGTPKGSLVGSERSLSFPIKGCRKVSHISIALNHRDTYDIEFIQCRGGQRKVVETCEDIYFDSLHDVISRVTGLALQMPRIIGINA
jgi:hypothetical protein